MTDLFSKPHSAQPLAALLRPKSFEDIIGQEALTNPGSAFRRRVDSGNVGSMILYGPPGVGKTSLARLVGQTLNKSFKPLHATRAGVKDIRALADEAKMTPLLIFVDEVHRFSATQADDLLAITEEGTADFIGATTQNPYHSLPPALISRSSIYKLEPVSLDATKTLLTKALAMLNSTNSITIPDDLLTLIAGRSGGDARRALTTLESLVVGQSYPLTVTQAMIEDVYAAAPILFDRAGDQHYDVISALIKSMRGSDPDATLYWLARLIHSGEDPRFIARRLMIHASEDIGLADNTALQTAVAAATAVEKIGYPEAQIVLAHAALHIARAPKSNAACRGIGMALDYVTKAPPIAVPLHLRDAHYKGAKALGHEGYLFPHDDPRGWVEQVYAPGIQTGQFYQSDARESPTFEQRADAYWDFIKSKKP